MAWSYSGDPSSSDLDSVRFLVGDTDINDQQLQDEEINYLLAQNGNNVYLSAAAAANAIAAKFARLVDKSVGDLKLNFSQRQAAYATLAKELEVKGAQRVGVPYAGGISLSDKDKDQEDTDLVQPTFKRDQFSFPGNQTENKSRTRDDLGL